MDISTFEKTLDEFSNTFDQSFDVAEIASKNTENLLFKPSEERWRFMKAQFQKLYPDMSGYWANDDIKAVEKNCIEVAEWFGMAPNEEVVKGNAPMEEQVCFWWHIVKALEELEVLQKYNTENTEIPMFGQLKSLVLRSNVVIELIRFSDTLENIQPALQTLTNIVNVASTEVERIRIVLHEIASKKLEDMLFICLTEQVNHEKRYRDLVIQTFNLLDSFMKLYFVALPKEGCVKIRKTPTRHGYEVQKMLTHIEEVSKNIHKMITSIQGLKEVFQVVNKKIADVAEFRPAKPIPTLQYDQNFMMN